MTTNDYRRTVFISVSQNTQHPLWKFIFYSLQGVGHVVSMGLHCLKRWGGCWDIRRRR